MLLTADDEAINIGQNSQFSILFSYAEKCEKTGELIFVRQFQFQTENFRGSFFRIEFIYLPLFTIKTIYIKI